jgi:hypothetical protein
MPMLEYLEMNTIFDLDEERRNGFSKALENDEWEALKQDCKEVVGRNMTDEDYIDITDFQIDFFMKRIRTKYSEYLVEIGVIRDALFYDKVVNETVAICRNMVKITKNAGKSIPIKEVRYTGDHDDPPMPNEFKTF